MTFSAGQILTASDLNDATKSGLGFYERGTTSSGSTSTTAVGICRINAVPCVSGQPIAITYLGHPDSTTITDNVRTEVRVSTSGSATSSSTLINQSRAFGAASASHRCVRFIYTPGTTGNHSFALCLARDSGSGTVTFYAGDGVRKTQLSAEQWTVNSYAGGEDL